jgi:hypothetical protein
VKGALILIDPDSFRARGLVGEDLAQDLILHLIELFEGGLEHGAIVSRGGMHVVTQPMGGVVHEEFGILQSLGVAGDAEVDQVGVVLDALQGGAGGDHIPVQHLFASELGHGVDQLGEEEALFLGTGGESSLLQQTDRLGSRDKVIYPGGVSGCAERKGQWKREQQKRGPEGNFESELSDFHNAPWRSAY